MYIAIKRRRKKVEQCSKYYGRGLVCPSCGIRVGKYDNFCSYCGQPFQDSKLKSTAKKD